jgi:hypothetical protein
MTPQTTDGFGSPQPAQNSKATPDVTPWKVSPSNNKTLASKFVLNGSMIPYCQNNFSRPQCGFSTFGALNRMLVA